MSPRRVVVTGTGIISSLGNDVPTVFENLMQGRTGVRFFPEWQSYRGLRSFLGAPAVPYEVSRLPRTIRRSMSPMSEMAALASLQALGQSDFKPEGSTLICMGSTTGSPEALETYFRKLIERGGPEGQLSTSFFKVMNHSVAANVAAALGFNGPVLSPSSACATSTQAIVLGWQLIQSGVYEAALVGGADELHYTSAAIFDNVLAASRQLDPDQSPRPFDLARDGLVVSEGAGVLLLESETHARNRNALILGEVLGGASRCDSTHMTQSQTDSMTDLMKESLKLADRKPTDIDYVNAHATGTLHGDAMEAQAIAQVFGPHVPVSSLKGHMGHSLAPCGTQEAILGLEMMRQKTLIPTRNLSHPDPACGEVNLIREVQSHPIRAFLSNNFAFGGMAACVIIGRYEA